MKTFVLMMMLSAVINCNLQSGENCIILNNINFHIIRFSHIPNIKYFENFSQSGI